MDGARALDDGTDFPLTPFERALVECNTLDDNLVLLRQGAQNNAGLALVLARNDAHFVSFLIFIYLNDFRRE